MVNKVNIFWQYFLLYHLSISSVRLNTLKIFLVVLFRVSSLSIFQLGLMQCFLNQEVGKLEISSFRNRSLIRLNL